MSIYKETPGLKLLLTAREAAGALSVSERTLWELTASGELPVLRLPGRGKARALRYDVADLRAWIDRLKAGPQEGEISSDLTGGNGTTDNRAQ
jgi:excisionase family DNA binding protein